MGKCFVCNDDIERINVEAGHIIPEYKGGKTNLNNLKSICSTCNKSMGVQHLDDFKEKYHSFKLCDKPLGKSRGANGRMKYSINNRNNNVI